MKGAGELFLILLEFSFLFLPQFFVHSFKRMAGSSLGGSRIRTITIAKKTKSTQVTVIYFFLRFFI